MYMTNTQFSFPTQWTIVCHLIPVVMSMHSTGTDDEHISK